MANGAFTAHVASEVAKRKKVMLAIRNEAAQRTVEAMQEPGPSMATTKKAIAIGVGLGKLKANGARGVSKRAFGPVRSGGAGHLPIDTGFLRSSLVALNGRQTPAQIKAPEGGGTFTYDEGQVTLVIASAALSNPITVAYSAIYARKMEARYRFVSLAAQQWQRIVDETTRDAQARMR